MTRPSTDEGGAPLRIRQAVRAVLTTQDTVETEPGPSDSATSSSILLVRFEFPSGTVWALPGGGLDPGEDHLTALRRELIEEVGLHDAEIGPHIWSREHIVPFVDGRWDGQNDRYHLVRVPRRFEPRPALTWEQLRDERLHELRWWTVDEIATATSTGTRFAPGRLALLLSDLHTIGVPSEPVDTGV